MSSIRRKLRNNEKVFRLYKKLLKLKKKALFCLSPISPTLVSKIQYKSKFGRRLDLGNPTYFNEKLMWLKLNKYADDKLVIQCSDKFAVREYIKSCGLENILNELYGSWTDANEIDWETLPEKFAIKCNHGCGYNLICKDKRRFDISAATKQLNKWMHSDSWREYAEVHYSHIPKKIICEKFISGPGGGLPVDYKIYCFNGVPLYIGNFIERNMEEGTIIRGYFDLNWNPSQYFKFYKEMELDKFPKPKFLKDMIRYAEILSKPFPFVRVDLYETNEGIVFGELTFTPTGCLGNYYSDSAYKELGNKLSI